MAVVRFISYKRSSFNSKFYEFMFIDENNETQMLGVTYFHGSFLRVLKRVMSQKKLVEIYTIDDVSVDILTVA